MSENRTIFCSHCMESGRESTDEENPVCSCGRQAKWENEVVLMTIHCLNPITGEWKDEVREKEE